MQWNQTVVLKNGQKCTLRSGTQEDAKAVYENFLLTHAQTDFLLSYPEENSFTVEQEGEFLRARAEDAHELELLAVVNGSVVGMAGIDAVGRKQKVRHRATFSISVDRAYWGLGIGRALTEACLEAARHAGYQQLELEVVRENRAAIALYESVGFREYGRNPRGFLSKHSGWQELVLMRLELLPG